MFLGLMKIGAYNIPMAETIMPWILLALLAGAAKIMVGRMWHDKEISLKKIIFLGISIGLMFVIILNINDVITWVWSMVCKAMDIIKNVEIK